MQDYMVGDLYDPPRDKLWAALDLVTEIYREALIKQMEMQQLPWGISADSERT
jgi:hypothetical protein